MLRNRLASLLVAVAVGAVFLAGLFVHAVGGAVLLIVVAIFLGYLSSKTWPALDARARLLRLVVLAAVAIFAMAKIATS